MLQFSNAFSYYIQIKELWRVERELTFFMEFPLVPILALVANTEASE